MLRGAISGRDDHLHHLSEMLIDRVSPEGMEASRDLRSARDRRPPSLPPTLATKRRPAVAVSSAHFHEAHDQPILAMITSAAGGWPGDVVLWNWRQTGLDVPCKVRLKLFTLDEALIVRRAGALSKRDGRVVRDGLSRFLAVEEGRCRLRETEGRFRRENRTRGVPAVLGRLSPNTVARSPILSGWEHRRQRGRDHESAPRRTGGASRRQDRFRDPGVRTAPRRWVRGRRGGAGRVRGAVAVEAVGSARYGGMRRSGSGGGERSTMGLVRRSGSGIRWGSGGTGVRRAAAVGTRET